MIEKKNLVFLSQHSSDKEVMVLISNAITSEAPQLYIINRENGMPYMLNSSQLNDIRRKHPNTVDIYTSKPIFQNRRTTSLGKWQSTGVNDILISKCELDQPKEEKFIDIDTASLEAKMSITSAWYKNDFAKILTIHNSQLDEQGFRDLIYFEVALLKLTPLPVPFESDSGPKERNYLFSASALLELAQSKNLNVGGLNKSLSIADIPSNNDDETIRPSLAERKIRIQEEADKVQNDNPKATKQAIVTKVISNLLKQDRLFIEKDDGTPYPPSSVERFIKLKKIAIATV